MEHYGDVRIEAIAAHVGRTVTAVHNRANEHRLGPDRPHDVMSLNQVLHVLGEPGCHGRFLGPGGLVARGLLRAELRSQYGSRPVWWVRESDLVAFLRDNPHLVDRDLVQPPYRRHVAERWILLSEAFRRGAAHTICLLAAVKAGCIPEARHHGARGSKWAIPESILPRLVEGRRRFVTDAAHRRLVVAHSQAAERKRVKDVSRALAVRYMRDARGAA